MIVQVYASSRDTSKFNETITQMKNNNEILLETGGRFYSWVLRGSIIVLEILRHHNFYVSRRMDLKLREFSYQINIYGLLGWYIIKTSLSLYIHIYKIFNYTCF